VKLPFYDIVSDWKKEEKKLSKNEIVRKKKELASFSVVFCSGSIGDYF
jgi:uncharacterized membrane-anchored protein